MTVIPILLLIVIAAINFLVALRGGRYQERLLGALLSAACFTAIILNKDSLFVPSEMIGLWIALLMLATVAPLFFTRTSHIKK